MSNKTTAAMAGTTKVVVLQPLHEVDGVVLKIGHTYEIPNETIPALIESGVVKEA